eukprot:TRINITY_DN30742_c0_g1_i1.p1 TRINITY_DN30742_c0_g1~~TRINITY_DN30742_c0_g1_i1.p1  ORF type:complete len:219 (+),score=21.14 TRINITY_DN30742_c0_g1_i1:67-723(+)
MRDVTPVARNGSPAATKTGHGGSRPFSAPSEGFRSRSGTPSYATPSSSSRAAGRPKADDRPAGAGSSPKSSSPVSSAPWDRTLAAARPLRGGGLRAARQQERGHAPWATVQKTDSSAPNAASPVRRHSSGPHAHFRDTVALHHIDQDLPPHIHLSQRVGHAQRSGTAATEKTVNSRELSRTLQSKSHSSTFSCKASSAVGGASTPASTIRVLANELRS